MTKKYIIDVAKESMLIIAGLRAGEMKVNTSEIKCVIEETRDFLDEFCPIESQEASLLICAAMDEASRCTGEVENLQKISLCNQYHKTTHAGEIFFDRVEVYLQNPDKKADLLKLCLFFLSTGFKGKYALLEGGAENLLTIRMRIFNVLPKSNYRVPPSKNRSKRSRISYLPYLPILVFSMVLVIAVYGYYMCSLSGINHIVKNNIEKVYFGKSS